MNVYIQLSKNNDAVIQLIDMYGKTIVRLNKNLLIGRNHAKKYCGFISRNLFFSKVQNSEWIKTEKVIIEHQWLLIG